MASVFAHAAVIVVGRGSAPKRQLLAAIGCALVADLDFVLAPLSEAPDDLFAHRGIGHSLVAVLGVAAIASLLLGGTRRTFVHFLAAGLSHLFLDLITWGGPGVALFAPFSAHRFLLPPALRLIPVVPIGVDEYFGRLGAFAILNELLFVIAPVLLFAWVVKFFVRDHAARERQLFGVIAILWISVAALARITAPGTFAPPRERLITARDASPEADLSGVAGPLVTRFDELQAKGLFDRPLRPTRVPWASEFFPFWFGGHAGRWQDPAPTLIARTLFGTKAGGAPQERLSPTEKYDLSRGDASFTTTTATLALTHNRSPLPRFWFGLCNGAAAAAMAVEEPFRSVDVVKDDGSRVRFHPNDIKALLAAAYFEPAEISAVGELCKEVSFDSGRRCSVHPAALLIAALNRVGLTGESFLLEAHSTRQTQYFPVASVTVRIARQPYAPSSEPIIAELKPRVAKLVDVAMEFELASTLLRASSANVPDESLLGAYQRVGTHPVVLTYEATLALDAEGELIGGRYTGDPADGPDQLQFVSGSPSLNDDGTISAFPGLRWSAIDALAKASVSTASEVPTVNASIFERAPAVADPAPR